LIIVPTLPEVAGAVWESVSLGSAAGAGALGAVRRYAVCGDCTSAAAGMPFTFIVAFLYDSNKTDFTQTAPRAMRFYPSLPGQNEIAVITQQERDFAGAPAGQAPPDETKPNRDLPLAVRTPAD